MRTEYALGAAVALAGLLPLAAMAADANPVAGVWQKHEYYFTSMGVTSNYSCDGLGDQLKVLLKEAGARDDVKVSPSCSSPYGGPSRIASARLTFWSFAPEGSAPVVAGSGKDAAKSEPPVPGVAVWKSVDIRAGSPSSIQAGDCELVEQFDREVLKFFTIRNHASRMTCVPHQLELGGVSLKFETLAPLPKTEARPQ